MRTLSLVALATLATTVAALRLPVHVKTNTGVQSRSNTSLGSLDDRSRSGTASGSKRAAAAGRKKRSCSTTPSAPASSSTTVVSSTTTISSSTSTDPPAPTSTDDEPSTTTDAPGSPTALPGPTKTQDGAVPSQTKASDADPDLESLSLPLNYALVPEFTRPKTGGVMTYYAQSLTACGDTYDDSTYTAAISHLMYDSWAGANTAETNRNPVCGPFVTGRYFLLPTDEVVPGTSHATLGGDGLINCTPGEQCHIPLTATVTNPANNASLTVHIVDRCEGCADDDIDLTPASFLKLTLPDLDTSGFAIGDYMVEASKNQLGRVPVTWSFDKTQAFGTVRGQRKTGCVQGCAVNA